MERKYDITDMPEHNKILLEWKTPEFIPHPKDKTWLITAGVIVLALVVYAILTESATMAIVFILIAGMYYLTHNQEPRIVDIGIAEMGIWIDNTFHSYNTISAFWIVYHPPFVRKIYLQLSGKGHVIQIELNQEDPVKVRHLLSKEIPEVEGREESTIDILTRILRLH